MSVKLNLVVIFTCSTLGSLRTDDTLVCLIWNLVMETFQSLSVSPVLRLRLNQAKKTTLAESVLEDTLNCNWYLQYRQNERDTLN